MLHSLRGVLKCLRALRRSSGGRVTLAANFSRSIYDAAIRVLRVHELLGTRLADLIQTRPSCYSRYG